MIKSEYKVWISVCRRLDGLSGRRSTYPAPYIEVVLDDDNKDIKRVELSLDIDMAGKLARGLARAVKNAKETM